MNIKRASWPFYIFYKSNAAQRISMLHFFRLQVHTHQTFPKAFTC
jgi:hypothetical protein